MSYTRLDESAGNISWDGENSHTRLNETAGNMTFYVAPSYTLPELDGSISTFPVSETSVSDYFFGEATNNRLSGNITEFEQRIGNARFVNKTITSFEQTIEHIRRLANTITEFEQTIVKRLSGNVTIFEQIIREPTGDNIDKYGWDALLIVNGQEISHSILKGMIKTDHQESSSSLMTFMIQPPFGVQDLTQYVGKTVTLDYLEPSKVTRIYTGIIDSPEIDINGKRITFNCTNDRETLINEKMQTLVKSIGFYSPQKTPTDNPSEELEQRLRTVPTAVDFDFNENVQITSWFAKGTADFTFTNPDVYYDTPSITWYNAARVTNKININFVYQYQRLYHLQRQFRWQSTYANNICDFTSYGYSLCPRDAIRNALDGTGWKVRGSIAFDDLWPSGWYTCGGVDFAWSTQSLQGQSVAVTDSEGNPVKDSDGNQVYESVLTGITNYGNIYCLGFTANMTTRWLQNIDEIYNLTVTAPQSIEQLGTIEENRSGNIEANEDELVSNWENYTQYQNPPLSTITTSSYYIDRRNNVNDFEQSLTGLINEARTSILSAHRQTTVNLRVRVNPNIQLRHTVETNIDPIKCRGKVRRIQHILDVINRNRTYMNLDIAIFQAGTSAVTDSSFVNPSKPTDSINLDTSSINLNSWYGVDPNNIPSNLFNGHIGNRYLVERLGTTTNRYRTNYQEAFIVDTPAISNNLRLQRDLLKSGSYNVSIPNDYLVIEF